jgi:membrane protein YdbS with pleckstrin-like domain
MDSQTAPTPSNETTLWEGHSSQVVNLPTFILCGLAAGILLGAALLLHTRLGAAGSIAVAGAALVPLVIATAKWIQNQCRRYEVTTERIHLRQGVLSRKTDALELYRVKDYLLVEPFFLRVFGLGNIVLTTADETNPTVVIEAIPQIQALRDQIRKQVEACRTRKGVRVAELE